MLYILNVVSKHVYIILIEKKNSLGNCGIHVLHDACNTGQISTEWELGKRQVKNLRKYFNWFKLQNKFLIHDER